MCDVDRLYFLLSLYRSHVRDTDRVYTDRVYTDPKWFVKVITNAIDLDLNSWLIYHVRIAHLGINKRENFSCQLSAKK